MQVLSQQNRVNKPVETHKYPVIFLKCPCQTIGLILALLIEVFTASGALKLIRSLKIYYKEMTLVLAAAERNIKNAV